MECVTWLAEPSWSKRLLAGPYKNWDSRWKVWPSVFSMPLVSAGSVFWRWKKSADASCCFEYHLCICLCSLSVNLVWLPRKLLKMGVPDEINVIVKCFTFLWHLIVYVFFYFILWWSIVKHWLFVFKTTLILTVTLVPATWLWENSGSLMRMDLRPSLH